MKKFSLNFLQKRYYQKEVKTRFAPSPTGFMHLGALRTALYSYLYAKQKNGKFVLRIEDTDQKRSIEGSVEQIKKTLNWVSIKVDEFHVQSERKEKYQRYAQELINKGHAYKCFCSSDRLTMIKDEGKSKGSGSKYDRYCLSLSSDEILELENSKKPYVVRMKVPEKNIILKDAIFGKIKFKHDIIDDQILLKSDGFPTYHLACVVDDHEMDISHVIRGSEWISSTCKHYLLYEMFNWEMPTFAHLPLLVNKDGSKLSKRQGHSSVDWYRDEGFLPESLINFVSMLGWTPEGEQEIFSLEELIEKFSLERVNKGNSMVSLQKLEWTNSKQIKRLIEEDIEKIVKIVEPQFQNIDREYLKLVLKTVKDRMKNLNQFSNHFQYFFEDINFDKETTIQFQKKIEKIEKKFEILEKLNEKYSSLETFENEKINDVLNSIKEELDISYNDVVSVLRFSITGSSVGATIARTVEILGKEKILKRLNDAKYQL